MPPAEEAPLILESEVAYAIRRMKPGTAPGPDGISADLFRVGGSALCSLLTKHFNHYLRLGRIPDVWKESRTVLIFKKGQREDISNYRPISLLSVVYKIFIRILLNRHTAHRKEPRIPDFTCPCLRGLSESVRLGGNQRRSERSCACFSNTSTTIQLFDRKLTIPIEKGVRQGDTISPKLFTAALQDAMKNLDAKGYPVDGKRIINLRFADDIVLISNSTAEAEKMLSELNMAGRKIGHEHVQNAIYGQPVV
ncbi:hypothetical protein Q1695_015607 [Nippostrongylus brasiliensis]|nr:hypothetical protein Q1695_015607 [Nippostrongylus brasiliensis]